MTYTEIKERNKKEYYYRVVSIRAKDKVGKKRVYLGANLNADALAKKEKEADYILIKNKSIEEVKSKIIPILKRNKVKKAGIFGSYSLGKAKKSSDIDILIEPPKGMGFKLAGLEIELSKALKKKIDLVTYNGLSPYLKNRILSQEVRIL